MRALAPSLLGLLFVAACGGSSGSDAGTDGSTADGASDSGEDLGAADLGIDAGPPTAAPSCGPLVGTRPLAGVQAFLGVPFAAPPTGANRFLPPQPATCWTGTRDATAYGAVCMQHPSAALPVPGTQSEDCLTLNVWAPDPMPATPAPVMVWFYGGAFTLGGTTQPFYEGAHLAAQGVVVVTVNYRLGAFGWMAHPALTAEDPHHSSGDYGLLDQIQSLHWVHDEIAAFGGDPRNVTLFGESAGALSACSIVGSPLADGLYTHAILESGSCIASGGLAPLGQITLADAESRSTAVAAALGCTTGDVAACLRGKTAAELLAAQLTLGAVLTGLPYNAVVDGYVLPRSTRDRLLDPTFTPPPILLGSNHDEARFFTGDLMVPDEAAYEAAIGTLVGSRATAVLAAYPATDYPTPKDAYDAVARDLWFTCPTRALARLVAARQPHAYLYEFDQVNAGAAALGFGGAHATELPYVFGNFTFPFTRPTADDRAMNTAMQGYWTRFATTGDPNGGGATTWPAFTTAGDVHLELVTPITTGTGLRGPQCDAIDALP